MVNDKMVNGSMVHIIMPVKDSLETAEQAIRAIIASGHTFTVYDDYSTPENAARLDALQDELGFRVIHISEHLDHPSPNYRWVLIQAQQEALQAEQDLVIIESDVIVRQDTIDKLIVERQKSKDKSPIGLVAAVTVNEEGTINFPYEYAKAWKEDKVCTKRLSFCCTLLSNAFLQAYDFHQLDETKHWYDVHISHTAPKLGFTNILQITNPVLHKPHSSRPWKQLKYTNPLLYYWRKFTQHRDTI